MFRNNIFMINHLCSLLQDFVWFGLVSNTGAKVRGHIAH